MALNTKTFTVLVQDQVAAIQGAARTLVDLTVGSILRALTESVALVVLWIQSLILQLLAATRAATASGSDLDTWMADYGLTRLPALAATGSVTFSRFTPTLQAVVPIGAIAQTGDGTQQFKVQLDTTNTAYSASQGGYVLAAGTASVTVPVTASVAGSGANVSVGQINTIAQAMPGVDTVSNASAFTNGADAETDAAFRARFALYISGLREGIKSSVQSAIANLQAGVQYTLVENQTLAGLTQYGYFYVVINPYTTTLQQQVYGAVDAVRPLGSTFGVFSATQVTVNVGMTVTAKSGYTHSQVAAAVTTAVQNFIAGLGLGVPLYWSQLYAVAYSVAGVQEVTGLTANSGTADISATAQQVLVCGTVTVS